MNKTIKRSKIFVLVASLAIVLALLAGMFTGVFTANPARAEGNNAGSSAITDPISLVLDVNGRDPDTDERDNADNVIENNGKHYRSRYLTTTVVAKLKGLSGDTYSFDKDSIIKSSTCFDVDVSSSGNTVIVTAKKFTEAEIPAFFSIVMYEGQGSNHTAEHIIHFSIKVDDTFAQITDGNRGFYVGYKLNAAGKEIYGDNNAEVSSYDGNTNTHAPILTVNNYSTLKIDLADYLQGRGLYRNSDHSAVKFGESFWAVNSVTNFEITDVSFMGLASVNLQNRITTHSTAYSPNGTAPIRISPSVSGTVEVSAAVVNQYNQRPGNVVDFWDTVHTLSIDLKLVSGNETNKECTIYLPFKFAPANPQAKNIASDKLMLNFSSENTYNLAQGNYTDGDGATQPSAPDHKTLIVRPEALVDYAYPGAYHSMTFDHLETKLNGEKISDTATSQINGVVISRLEGEENSSNPTAYAITADETHKIDSSHRIEFAIDYYVGAGVNDFRTVTVEIIVTTYGGYTITFQNIKGKRPVTYNVLTDEVFSRMRDLGYMLTAVTSKDEDKLAVSLRNSVLTLSPQVKNIGGETNVAVTLEFTNYYRQKITFDSETINIDVNAGSLFARFDDWEAGLIIAAICLGGLIIILLIVWLFIRAISKRRQEEMATQAPVSSYIVKLNSTIAATQAQQRMAQNQALSQASQMLLGAGLTGAAPAPPDTLQLASGVGGATSMPGGSMSMPGGPAMSEPQATVPPDQEENLEELIAKYITDDELLERIFTEKYEPKGMVRRTFFKSKDLQARELEKEKKRIIERYKTPMPMDEAIMSENEIQNSERTSSPAMSAPSETSEPKEQEMFVLGFDPDSPLYVEPQVTHDEFSEEKIDIDSSPEEQRLKDAERRNEILRKELAELASRMQQVNSQLEKANSLEAELREKIAKAEADDEQYGKDIEDLEFRLASAKNKDKPTITRDIGIKEEKKKRNLDELEKLRAELDALLGNSEKLNDISSKLEAMQTERNELNESLVAELEKARAEFEAYQDRLEKVRAKQELEAKVATLTPMLIAVNEVDYELRKLQAVEQEQDKERESLKDSVAAAKAQIMSTTDFGVISDLNMQISDANARLADIEKENTKTTKRKSELNIELNAQRRKANEFVEDNEIPLESVIDAEDIVIGNIELELLKAVRQKDKDDAEKAVADAQAVFDDLSASAGDVALVAMDVASAVGDIEEEITAAQAELDAINAQMESAGEDERLMLMVDQGDKADKIEELKARLEQAHVDGTKRKMEAQAEYDAKLEQARGALNEANAEFAKACASYDDLVQNTNPVDLVISGSGIISKDQKIIEAENLKKQLERSKNEIEQARLAAQQAQEEAERVRLEAERAAEEARLEAERSAEEARLEAERVAEEARLEAERAKQEAEERAEQARAEAERAAEQARLEAEEKARAEAEAAELAKKEAEEAMAAEVEEARRKAMEEAEEAKRKAQEEAEEAKRQAQGDIEEMRRKAEEEAEAKRLEEENKKKEEEERQKADAARDEALAKKIAMRKEQIIAIRNEMKELKGDEDAKNLRERLYNIQLTYDEDERGSTELMDFYNKTMDDIQNAGEIARLKAENAKKPQRVVRKVTERVNRIAKRRPGARPGARPASRAGVRSARPGARPAGARPSARPGARPGARPARPGARPAGARPPARPGNRPTRPR